MTMPALAAVMLAASPVPAEPVALPPPSHAAIAASQLAGNAPVVAAIPVLHADTDGLLAYGDPADLMAEPTLDSAAPDAEQVEQSSSEDPISSDDPNSNVIVVEGITEAPPGDPLHQINAQTYTVVQDIDGAVIEPIANVYNEDLPRPVRRGLSNFFRNLREPIVFLNFLLQGKPGKAMETVGRFGLNSTLGVGGLFDVAKREPFNLPHRKNGFANTLGYYGVGQGPFFYLPLVGPTTLRDGVGSLVDTAVLPFAIGKPFNTPYYAISSYTVRSLDERLEFHDKHQRIADSNFPYATMRETYLCDRVREIEALHGRPPSDCMPEEMKDLDEAVAAPGD